MVARRGANLTAYRCRAWLFPRYCRGFSAALRSRRLFEIMLCGKSLKSCWSLLTVSFWLTAVNTTSSEAVVGIDSLGTETPTMFTVSQQHAALRFPIRAFTLQRNRNPCAYFIWTWIRYPDNAFIHLSVHSNSELVANNTPDILSIDAPGGGTQYKIPSLPILSNSLQPDAETTPA